MSPDALDLIVKLLNRNPMKRLGSGPDDAESIKAHPFFSSINWIDAANRNLQPPKPRMNSLVKTANLKNVFADKDKMGINPKDLKNWSFIDKDFY